MRKLKMSTAFLLWPIFWVLFCVFMFFIGFYKAPDDCGKRDKWIWESFWDALKD